MEKTNSKNLRFVLKNGIATYFAIAILFVLGVNGYGKANPADTAVANVPPSLAQMGEYGENIYDAAKAKNWKEADAKLAALKGAIQNSAPELAKAPSERAHLQNALAALETAVNKQNSWTGMREANQITLTAANLSASYHPKIPADVARLDYDGRELEIWSAANNLPKLKTTAQQMQQTWDRLRPEVESHNGAAEARKFSELVTKVEEAQSVSQYRQLADPVLNEVDKLEKVF